MPGISSPRYRTYKVLHKFTTSYVSASRYSEVYFFRVDDTHRRSASYDRRLSVSGCCSHRLQSNNAEGKHQQPRHGIHVIDSLHGSPQDILRHSCSSVPSVSAVNHFPFADQTHGTVSQKSSESDIFRWPQPSSRVNTRLNCFINHILTIRQYSSSSCSFRIPLGSYRFHCCFYFINRLLSVSCFILLSAFVHAKLYSLTHPRSTWGAIANFFWLIDWWLIISVHSSRIT